MYRKTPDSKQLSPLGKLPKDYRVTIKWHQKQNWINEYVYQWILMDILS